MVKPIGGLKGFLGESRKYYLRAESDYGLVLYPAIKRNIEDNKTSAACVGQCWNGSQANLVEVLVATPTELRVLMDQETYSITFDDEAVATVWNTYFQVRLLLELISPNLLVYIISCLFSNGPLKQKESKELEGMLKGS